MLKKVADENGIMFVLDASLIGENAYFIKKREEEFKNTPIKDILKLMCSFADIVYFSSRKVSSTRGGGICTRSRDLYLKMRELVTLYEGFLTYGGISVREIEAMAVVFRETADETVISQSPMFIEYTVNELDKLGIPVITPAGALGVHIDAMGFLPHVPQSQYPLVLLRQPCLLFQDVAEWNAVPFQAYAMPMGMMCWPMLNCCA
jgi:tryptophanase